MKEKIFPGLLCAALIASAALFAQLDVNAAVDEKPVEAAWNKSPDLVVQQMDARCAEVAVWLLQNLSDTQRAEFEAFLFPPLSKEEQLRAAVHERNLRQLRGKDADEVEAEIVQLKEDLVRERQAEAVEVQVDGSPRR